MVPEALDRALDELELCLERLNARYEGYLSRGDENEPTPLRHEVDRRVAALMSRHPTGAARIRLERLVKRYDGYQQTWEHRARRRRVPSVAPRPLFATSTGPGIRRLPTPPLGTRVALADGGKPSFRRRTPPPEASRTIPNLGTPSFMDASPTVTDLRSPAERGMAASGVTMELVREVYERLRRAAPVGSRGVSIERLFQTMRETEAKLIEKHGDRPVTFDVIVRDGRAILKPIVH